MEIRELRVGNYLKPLSPRHGETFIEVESISCDFINIDFRPYELITLEPIPITEELLLEKIDWRGYKKLYINSYFNVDNVGHVYYMSSYTGLNVTYLHTLQNLYFALTGEELLFKQKQ